MIKFEHPTIEIQTPAPGHYVIVGHQPTSTFVDGVGHVVPSPECYISPQVPSEALFAVLEDRGDIMDPENPEEVELHATASGKKAIEKLAGRMYDAYCEAVGGKAFNGDPLPAWKEFRADDKKTKQSDAWVAAAEAAIGGDK